MAQLSHLHRGRTGELMVRCVMLISARLSIAAAWSVCAVSQLWAQAPLDSGPIRHVAAGTFVYVVKGDGSVVGWGAEADGLATLVHCGAGHGRTGTMLACALVSRGRRAVEAIGELRDLDPGYIETPEQEALVYEVEWKAQRGSHGA